MVSHRTLALAAAVLGCLLLVVAVLYVALPAHALPGFFPGHTGTGGAEAGHHHVKHGIAAAAVGLAVLAYAWFATGPGHHPAGIRSASS
jgi:hypothetical protein